MTAWSVTDQKMASGYCTDLAGQIPEPIGSRNEILSPQIRQEVAT